MKTLIKLLSFFFFCFILIGTTNAQKGFIFNSLTTENGLPSNYILSIRQDTKGFLWAGTDKGLSRFDGYRWQTWDVDNGLQGNYINHIEDDRNGGVWMEVSSKGIFHFDGYRSVKCLDNLTGYYLKKSIVTSNGSLLLVLQNLDEKFTKGIFIKLSDPSRTEEVFSFSGDSQNFQISPEEENIYFINYPNIQAAQKTINFSGKWHLLPAPHFFSYNDRNFFFNNDSTKLTNSLFFLDEKTHKPKTIIESVNSEVIICNGSSYFTTRRNGFYILTGNKLTQITSKEGIGTDYINDLSATKDGTVLLATMGHGILLYNNNTISKYILNHAPVKTILQSNNGIYVLSGDDIYHQRLNADTFYYTGISVANATNLVKKGNDLYVGSYTGWKQFSLTNHRLSFTKEVIHSYGNSGLFITDSFTFASTYGRGILRYKNDIFFDSLSLPFAIIEKLFPLQNGFAATSFDNGVVLLNGKNNSYQHLTKNELLSNTIYHVFENENDLWISTRFGINYLINGKVVDKFTYANGFKGTHAIFSFIDSAKRLWVLSDKYLHLKQGNKLIPVKSYQVNPDEKEIATTAFFNKEKQQLLIGSNKNLLLIDIWKIHPDSNVVIPQLAFISVDGKNISGKDFYIPASFKNILFSFSPGASKIISGVESRYKLTGLDDKWHSIPDSLSVSFSGLRYGNYDLLIQSTNGDGFSSEVKTIAHFKVRPPFWNTIWFSVLCIIVGSITTGIIISKVQKKKQQTLQKKWKDEQKLIIEKQRISRDLHDNLGANLIHIISKIDNLQQDALLMEDKRLQQKANSLHEEARNSIQLLRETVWTIKEDKITLGDFILRIRIYLQRILEERKQITWDLNFTGNEKNNISPQRSLHIFRIVQESINNILRHADATKVEVDISNDPKNITIIIKDNGIGFIKNENKNRHANNHFGLQHMEYRTQQIGGNITIESKPKMGTVIKLIMPLNM